MIKKQVIYLDWAASAPLDSAVATSVSNFLRRDIGNPSSIHSFGRSERAIIDQVKQKLAHWLGVIPTEIYFTSGATESINWVIQGFAAAGKTIISTPLEHKATLAALEKASQLGSQIILLKVDPQGHIKLPELQTALDQHPGALVSLTYVNNETGNIEDVPALGKLLAKKYPLARLHIDATQALGWLDCQLTTLGAHYLTGSAHKLGGMKGTGLLVMRQGVGLPGLIVGGGQEFDLRGGTENIAGIISWGVVGQNYSAGAIHHSRQLGTELIAKLHPIKDHIIHTDWQNSAGHIVNVSFAGLDGEALMMRLDLAGFAVSTGSACTTGATDPSHVLLAMGVGREQAKGALRISWGPLTKRREIQTFATALSAIIGELRKISGHGL